MIPARLELHELQSAFRDHEEKLNRLLSGNVDFRGRRIIGAGPSQGQFDYVTRFELDKLEKATTGSDSVTGLLNAAREIRTGAFATRGAAIAHDSEVFVASDLDYIGWVSTGGVWKYIFGIRAIALANLSTFAALLGTNDGGVRVEITDYDHILQWTGAAWTWGPGEVGSGYYQLFETTPNSIGANTWQICDGSTVARLNADGTTTNVAVPDVSTAAYLKGGTSAAAVAAAAGLTTAVSAGTPAGTVSQPTFTGNAVAAASTQATPDLVAADTSAAGVSPVTTATGTVSQPTFSGSVLATHQHGPNTLELRNKQAILYFRR